VGLNIPQIKLLAIWVGGMLCVIVTKLSGAQIVGVGGFKHRWATTTPTTMATARRDTTKMTMATEYDDDGDDPTAKAAPKKATPIHPPKYLSIPLYASTRAISGQMFNICTEIAPKMPQILPRAKNA